MSHVDVPRKNPNRAGQIVAVINQKGGVGKTTTVVNLATALSDLEYKVLVLDFDPQGNSTSGFGLGKDDLEIEVYDVITGDEPLSKSIVSTESGVFVVPSTVQLAGAEIELVYLEDREHVLQRELASIRDSFDFIFIDCPPSLGILTINALVAADSLLIPIQCEYYALEGVTKLLESMKMIQRGLNPSLRIFGILMTMYDGRTTLSRQVVEEVRNHFGTDVFKTIIPRSVKLSEAPSHGLPAVTYSRLNKGSLAYRNLAREVIRRGN